MPLVECPPMLTLRLVAALGGLALATAACEPQETAETDAAKPEPEARVNEGRQPMPEATKAQICADDCLLATRYDIHTVKHRFKDLCCGEDGIPADPRCQEDVWPFPKTTSCRAWEKLEMCVYAKYGYVFKEDSEWKSVFEDAPWYTPDGTFTASQMSITAKRNTLTLRQFVREGVDCVPEPKSPAATGAGSTLASPKEE